MTSNRKYNQNSYAEAALIGQVLEFLNSRGYTVWRNYATGHFNKSIASGLIVKLIVKMRAVLSKTPVDRLSELVLECLSKSYQQVVGSKKGIPDIIGYDVDGRFVAVEVKTGTDRLSDDQMEFIRDLREKRGETWVIRDFDAFVRSWESRNAPSLNGMASF